MSSHQLNCKTHDLVLLLKTIRRYWDCFLSPVATDGMGGNGLKLEKNCQFFQVLMLHVFYKFWSCNADFWIKLIEVSTPIAFKLPFIATALFLKPPIQLVQHWFSLSTFFSILWPDFDTFQPSQTPFLLLHCPLELPRLFSICPLFLLLQQSLNLVSWPRCCGLSVYWNPKDVCSSHFPERSQGHDRTICHSGQDRTFLTDPIGLPWPRYHVLSCILSEPILSNHWQCDLQFHFCPCTVNI